MIRVAATPGLSAYHLPRADASDLLDLKESHAGWVYPHFITTCPFFPFLPPDFSFSFFFFFLSKRSGTLLALETCIIIFKTPASALPKNSLWKNGSRPGTTVKQLVWITSQGSPSVLGIGGTITVAEEQGLRFRAPSLGSHAWLASPSLSRVGERKILSGSLQTSYAL